MPETNTMLFEDGPPLEMRRATGPPKNRMSYWPAGQRMATSMRLIISYLYLEVRGIPTAL